MRSIIVLCACLFLASTAAAAPQTAPSPAGHWEGSLTTPGGDVAIALDLDRDAGGTWTGDLDIPVRGVKDMPLKNVTVSGALISFELPIGGGQLKFQGKLSEDGNSIAGDFNQGGQSIPFSLKRAGEAKVRAQVKNATLPEALVGKWEGMLETPGAKLRIVFHFSNKDGAGVGSVDSPDQGTAGIPMDEISVTGDAVKIEIRTVGGSFAGKLNQDGKSLAGELTQGGNQLPLTLVKAPPAEK